MPSIKCQVSPSGSPSRTGSDAAWVSGSRVVSSSGLSAADFQVMVCDVILGFLCPHYSGRRNMTEPLDTKFVANALLEEGGRVDALLAAVVGILQATRNNPEVAIAVQQNLA